MAALPGDDAVPAAPHAASSPEPGRLATELDEAGGGSAAVGEQGISTRTGADARGRPPPARTNRALFPGNGGSERWA